MSRDAPPEEIVDVLVAAQAGRFVLPIWVAQVLALDGDPADHPPVLPAEATWLSALAAGVTVTQLAGQAGYSEREMFRRLADLYTRMGASTRTEALLAAGRWGLL